MASSGVRRRTSYHAPRRTWQLMSPRTRAHCGTSGMLPPPKALAGRRQSRRRAPKATTAASQNPRAMIASSHHANGLRLTRAPFWLEVGQFVCPEPAGRLPSMIVPAPHLAAVDRGSMSTRHHNGAIPGATPRPAGRGCSDDDHGLTACCWISSVLHGVPPSAHAARPLVHGPVRLQRQCIGPRSRSDGTSSTPGSWQRYVQRIHRWPVSSRQRRAGRACGCRAIPRAGCGPTRHFGDSEHRRKDRPVVHRDVEHHAGVLFRYLHNDELQ